MKTIKIIDLLNKIANGEITKLHKFKWDERIWEEYSKFEEIDNDKSYQEKRENGATFMRFESVCDARHFNDEVEILDEEDEFEDIEELYSCCMETKDLEKQVLRDNINTLSERINQLIKNQKKIIDKLNKE